MEIGGFFPYQPVDSEPNNYVEHICLPMTAKQFWAAL